MNQNCAFFFVALIFFFHSQTVLCDDQSNIKASRGTLWQKLLKEQLKHEKNCDMSEILTYDEMKVGDEIVISGKVLCLGGQQYEYTRLRQHLKFEFRVCDPTLC